MKQKLSLLAAIACLCGGGGGYEAQAQLVINAYPSQDNPTNQTLWIFRGSSTTVSSNSIRASGAYRHSRDSWEFDINGYNEGYFYNANSPSDQIISLSPLFSSSNTKDIASVNARIPGGGKTNITFAASATNTPTITIGSGSRTISHLFMNDGGTLTADSMGIRVSGSNLPYSSGQSSAWVGAGLINKPIGDFVTGGTFDNRDFTTIDFAASGTSSGNGLVRVRVNGQVIPEPEEYALVFGLFALGFVLFHRHRQRKQRHQQAPIRASV